MMIARRLVVAPIVLYQRVVSSALRLVPNWILKGIWK